MKKIKRENLNKKDISEEIYNKFGLPKLYAENFLNDTIKVIIDGLKKDEVLKIDNFGSFKVIKKNKRVGRNPKTREEHEIKERNTVSFKASDFLKRKINNV